MNAMQNKTWLEHFLLYRYVRKVEDDINLHKWYQSEKVGHDVGWDRAMVDWTIHIAESYFKNHPAEPNESNS